MKFSSKLTLAVGAALLGLFVAYRETSSMCGPAKADAHGHGHGHGEEQEAGHAAEGFGMKVCEDGVVRAVWESIWPSSADMAVRKW